MAEVVAQTAGSVSGRGSSSSWTQQQKNVIRIFNLFRLYSPDVARKLPAPWDELPEEILCTNENDIYGLFAHFLLNVYLIEVGESKGQFLKVDPVTNYFSTSINLAFVKFHAKGSDKTKLFFTCLNFKAGTPESKWLIGMKKEITRVCFQRSIAAGEELDHSETPLYHKLFRLMIRAYSREGSPDAADRKLVLQSLWSSGGRSSEVLSEFINCSSLSK